VPLAIAGLAAPLVAAAAMSGSSLLVILNASRPAGEQGSTLMEVLVFWCRWRCCSAFLAWPVFSGRSGTASMMTKEGAWHAIAMTSRLGAGAQRPSTVRKRRRLAEINYLLKPNCSKGSNCAAVPQRSQYCGPISGEHFPYIT
jgi:hypothetical protein